MSFTEADLKRALAPLAGDPAEDARRVLAALPQAPGSAQQGSTQQGRVRGEGKSPPAWGRTWRARPWVLPLLVGVAAGFLLALLPVLFGFVPWRSAPRERGPFTLAAATGQVFVQRSGGAGIDLLATGAHFEPGDRLQTDLDACASVRLPEGSEVRLNAETVVSFAGSKGREVRVQRGEIWTRVAPAQERFVVHGESGVVEALGTVLDIVCTEDTLAVVALEGSAILRDRKGATRRVEKGQRGEVRGGAVHEPVPAGDLWRVTDWTVELLRFQGNHEEIEARVGVLLALIGRTKLDYLAEQEIRQLGTHCVLPMTRFIQEADPEGERQRRRYAAGLVADLADIAQARELFELLEDQDPEVRVSAFRGLSRLSGSGRVQDEKFWVEAPESERMEAASRWEGIVIKGEQRAKKK